MIRSCLALLAFLTLPAYAGEPAHPLTMWQVLGANNSVYLLGSVHLLRAEDYPLPTAFDAAYDDADVLVMEVDMDELDPLATQSMFNTYGVLHDEKTLRDLMGNELFEEAAAAAEIIDIPLEMLNKTEPWYAAMTVEMMMLSRVGFNPTLGIEMHMLAKATRDGKRVDGLETVEEQIQYLDSMSLPAQREMLISTLNESVKLNSIMDELIDAWRHGDTAVLETGMLEDMAKHEELNEALVVERNKRWVGQIESLLEDDKDYLIIVGALHLVGRDGVPKQLLRHGYDVRQLSEPLTVR
jgi:uncharacterized protein YbaP (TraB family)